MFTALIFFFLFHDVTLYLAVLGQLIVNYSCPSENVVVTVLLTRVGRRNIFIIITQPVVYLILSCWNTKETDNLVTDSSGQIQ